MHHRSHACVHAIALIAAIALCSAALAGVDAEIGGNAKVSGSLAPEGDVDIFRFDAGAGSLLSLSVAAKKKAPLDFTLSLFAPDGSLVALDGAAKLIDKGKKIAVKKLPLAQTGSYRLEITATGTGEYSLKLKASPAKTITRSIALAAGASGEVTVAALAGSSLTVKATVPKGDAALPRVVTVAGIDVSDLPGPKGNQHTVKVALGDDAGGDLSIALTNTAASAGTISVATKIKPPKVRKLKLDVRGASRGAPDGGETVLVRAVSGIGGVVAIDDASSPIDGVLLTVPPGALTGPTPISVSTADPVRLPDRDTQQAAGEAVLFGPEGLEFRSNATIVLRFDASSLPVGTDPLTDLRIVRRSASGATEIITPTSVNVETGTMTFQTSGFSTFMPFVPRGSPDLNGSEYWFMGFAIELVPDQTAASDSRDRNIDMTLGSVTLGPRGERRASSQSSEFRSISWTHDQNGIGSFPRVESGSGGDLGEWDYEPDGQTIILDFPDESGDSASALTVSEDGAYLVGGAVGDNRPGAASIAIAIRKELSPTLAALAGSYHMGGAEIAAPGDVGVGPLQVSLSRLFGELTLRADGTWSITLDQRVSEFVPGSDFTTTKQRFTIQGSVRVGTGDDGLREGALIFLEDGDAQDGDADSFILMPGEGGRVMIGSDSIPLEDGQVIFVAMRQTVGASKAILDGVQRLFSIEFEPTTYETLAPSIGPILIGDFSLCGNESVVEFDGRGRATELDFLGVCAARNESDPSGIAIEVEGPLFDSFAVKVSSNGRFSVVGDVVVGAVVRDGTFFFGVNDPKNNERNVELIFGIRPPPLALVTKR